jgi:hypothetical protein
VPSKFAYHIAFCGAAALSCFYVDCKAGNAGMAKVMISAMENPVGASVARNWSDER